jgi:5-methylcytosine-specific restriction endonuclease McrA
VEKLKMVQDLLAHAVPGADLGEVVDRALTALAEQLLRTKFAVTSSPQKGKDAPSTAEQPAAVRRAVYLRDRGRCTFVSKDGRRCDSRRYLQFDHVDGRAVGGAFTIDNVRLRCGPHNRLEAERLYGTPPHARDAGGARVLLAPRPSSVPGRMAGGHPSRDG